MDSKLNIVNIVLIGDFRPVLDAIVMPDIYPVFFTVDDAEELRRFLSHAVPVVFLCSLTGSAAVDIGDILAEAGLLHRLISVVPDALEHEAHAGAERGAFDYVLTSRLHRLPVCIRNVWHQITTERTLQRMGHCETVMREAIDGILLADVRGYYIDANRSACDLFQYKREEIRGAHIEQLLPAGILTISDRHGCYTVPHDYSRELRLHRRNGDAIDVEVRTRLLTDGKLSIVLRDISQRKRLEDQLRRSEELYRTATATIPNTAICMFDTDRTILLADGKAFAAMHCDSSALIGSSIADLLHTLAPDVAPSTVEAALRGDKSTFAYTSADRRFEAQIVPLTRADGPVWGGMMILHDITDRVHAEQEVRRALADKDRLLAHIEEQKSHMISAVLHTQEEERRRIAKDLHDSVGQMLSVLKFNLSCFADEAADRWPDIAAKIDRHLHSLDNVVEEVRSLAHKLVPTCLERFGLREALEDLVAGVAATGGVIVNSYIQTLTPRPSLKAETAVYRIAQEAISNALRHAGAGRLSVQLLQFPSSIVLTIDDNGRGFSTTAHSIGRGLENMRSRAESVSGTLMIDSSPGNGTIVTLEVPVEELIPV